MSDNPPPEGLNRVLERNIEALVSRRVRDMHARSRKERVADAITGFVGTMRFAGLHVAVFGGWALWNSGLLPVPRFDPGFTVLGVVASVEAIFLSTIVLISQNRMSAQNEQRAELHLQVTLLAEHEVTRAISMLTALTERSGVPAQVDSAELEDLRQDVAPERILEHIAKEHESKLG